MAKKISLRIKKLILKEYPEFSSREIGKKYGICQTTVTRTLRKNNIKIMPQGFYRKGKPSPTKINLPSKPILKMYKLGLTPLAISMKYKVTSSVIRRILKENNVTMRTYSEAFHRNSKFKNTNGYIIITPTTSDKWLSPNSKQIPEHRFVIAKHLGRPLTKNENVHHMNGIRDDNRLKNLELWNTCQPMGQRIQDKIAWAKEILKLYKNYKPRTK